MPSLYKVLTQRPYRKGNIYATKIQREEILLWRVSGGSYLSSIYLSKEKREAEQADHGDPAVVVSVLFVHSEKLTVEISEFVWYNAVKTLITENGQ